MSVVPNGWIDQDATWYGDRPRPYCVRWGPSSPAKKEHNPQFSTHVYCGQTAGWIKMPLGTYVIERTTLTAELRNCRTPWCRRAERGLSSGVVGWADRNSVDQQTFADPVPPFNYIWYSGAGYIPLFVFEWKHSAKAWRDNEDTAVKLAETTMTQRYILGKTTVASSLSS